MDIRISESDTPLDDRAHRHPPNLPPRRKHCNIRQAPACIVSAVLRHAHFGLLATLIGIALAACGAAQPKTAKQTPTTGSTAAHVTNTTPAKPTTTLPPGVAAEVGHDQITDTLLAHWMNEIAGEDYYSVAYHPAPPNIATEPPNYPACVASLKKLTPIPGEGPPQHQPTPTQLLGKCQEIHHLIRLQTLEYLIDAFWSEQFDAAHGMRVTNTEVRNALQRNTKETYPKPGQFARALTENHRTYADELFKIKTILLNEKILHRASTGPTAATFKAETEQTSLHATCEPGYTVEHCQGHQAPKEKFAHTNNGAPDKPLIEIARWRPETSGGFTGTPATN
jgi:hypothetical protein